MSAVLRNLTKDLFGGRKKEESLGLVPAGLALSGAV